jgi:DNA end-binding protein Ku
VSEARRDHARGHGEGLRRVERTYYLAPDRGGARAYRLLRDALRAAKLVAIASFASRGNAYVEMVRPFESGLAMHQLRYADEIRAWEQVELGELPAPTKHELELAEKLVAQLRHATWHPADYRDEVKERVRALLADKAKSGEEIEVEPSAKGPPVTDLMAALKASLGGGDRKPTRKAHVAHKKRAA